MKYSDYVREKLREKQPDGISVGIDDINDTLFPFQRKIVCWALRKGRAALFEDCGLGKTFQQLEWARFVLEYTRKPVLIYAPLTVARQTQNEAAKLGIEVRHVQFGAQILEPGIYVTNYERHHLFNQFDLGGIVLDESSILKNCDGKTRNALIAQAQGIPFRLCCTATPAPNDIAEIANHAEFLGIKTRTEMLSHWFVHDDQGWRLKGHASRDFYRWLASWSVYLRDPSDVGEDATGYVLPELSVKAIAVATDAVPEGFLFQPADLKGVSGRAAVRKSTIQDRVEAALKLIEEEPFESWIIWTGLNDESDAIEAGLKRTMADVVRVEGNTPEDKKIERLQQFLNGSANILITKPRVCGFGMNFQHCSRQIFLGIGDSWEAYYQCLRRSYRFGQSKPVQAYIVTSELETSIVTNVLKKEEEARRMGDSIIANMGELEQAEINNREIELPPWLTNQQAGRDFTLYNGDCVEVLAAEVASDSVDLSVYSPPFATLYTYSDNPRDMGNCVDHDQFFGQFRYLVEQVLRVTKPGRLTCVHVAQVTTTLAHDGVIGLTDFRGAVIDTYRRCGWVHYGEVCIDKCPQAQAIRTKAKALMFVQKNKDRSWSRPGLADFILVFKKPGENQVPIVGDVSNEDWIRWARPVWYGIRETNTLNVQDARSDKDERHICPLQLDVIERCVRLWSNPGELVLSPFAGIGSEGYESIVCGRKFVGVELKPEYFRVAVKNLRKAELASGQETLFGETL